MKKNQKNEKTKKKIEILFGRPNSSTVFKFSRKIKSKEFFRKSQDGSTGVINVHLTKQLPAGKQILTPSGELFMYYFRVPPITKQARKNRQKAPPAFISTPLCRTPRFKCFAEPF